MNAQDMHTFANAQLEESHNVWWNRNKDKIFESIKESAKSGKFQLNIEVNSKSNIDNFIDNSLLRSKVEKELKILGYETKYDDGSYYEDGDDKELIIKW